MKRPILLTAAVLAAGAAALVGWLLLGGSAPPAEEPPVRQGVTGQVPPKPPVKVPRPPPPSEVVTIRVDPPPEVPTEEPPPPPGVWPGEVPAWWIEADRRFREKRVSLDTERRSIRATADLIAKEAGFPVLFHESLAAWAEGHEINFVATDEPARALLEALALRSNLEMVLEPEALRFYQRGKIPPGLPVRAGRIRWAVMEACERGDGTRPADPSGAAVLERSANARIDHLPLREASASLGAAAGIPVILDAVLWAENPVVTVEAGERPLSELLARMCRGTGARVDATSRRIVLYKPGK